MKYDLVPIVLIGLVVAFIAGLFGFLFLWAVVDGNERQEFTRVCIAGGGAAYVSQDMHLCLMTDGTVRVVRP